jgi:hypothetical protein
VEKELEDRDPVLAEHSLEVVDLLIPLRPDGARNEATHADGQHVLVMRAVEDADRPPWRNRVVNAPEVVVAQLELARLLEAGHDAALRVHGVEHATDGAVFPARVSALQHDQQRPFGFRIQPVLKLREPVE